MRAVARPELFLPKDALARVDFESARTVYQQDNLATSLRAGVNDLLRRVPGLYLLSRR
jgi:outer membrane receptor for Fe3+-dicitrate